MFNKFFVRPWCGARICPTVNDPRRPTTATLLPFFSRFRPSILETRRRRRWNARGISPLLISPTKQHRGGVHRVLSFSCVITRVDRMPRPPSFPKPPHGIQRSFFLVPIKSLHREAAKIRENTGSRIVLDAIFIATRKF